jgi:hypothetical protein
VWLPADGKYAVNHNIKPKRDWSVYENAWHLLRTADQNRDDGFNTIGGSHEEQKSREGTA